MDTKYIFPKTLVEAISRYSDDEYAHATMARLRWPNGVTCPHCGETKVKYLADYRRWECSNKHQRRQFTVKVGTVFEDSPIAIGKWLMVIWMLTSDKNGISSYEIHRAIGVTQKSAWFMMHRVRLALKQGAFTKMGGIVEADEGMVGGKVANFSKAKKRELRSHYVIKNGNTTRNANLSHIVKKSIVMGLLERAREGNCSQVRTALIENRRRPHIQDAVRKNVEPGSILMTDSLKSYHGLGQDFVHETINHALAYARGNVHTNSLENFWSLLQRMLTGTYIACEPFHLEAYLDEQAFRFNTRKMTDGDRFVKALGGVFGKRLTYAELTGKVGEVVPPVQA